MRTFERLDLGFLVEREHHGIVRWIHLQPDHVTHLLRALRVGRDLERARDVRFQAKCASAMVMRACRREACGESNQTAARARDHAHREGHPAACDYITIAGQALQRENVARGGAWDDIGCNWRRARVGDQSMDGRELWLQNITRTPSWSIRGA